MKEKFDCGILTRNSLFSLRVQRIVCIQRIVENVKFCHETFNNAVRRPREKVK